AERRSTQTKTDSIFCRDDGHALGSPNPDPVLLKEDHVLVDFWRKVVQKLFQLLKQRGREIPFDTANAIPTGREARTAEFVEPIHQDFPIPKAIEKDAHGSDIESLGAEPKLMADYPLNLRHDRAQIFCTIRHGDIHEVFDRAAICKIVVHRTNIV